MRLILIAIVLLSLLGTRPAHAAAPTKAKLDEATKVVFAAFGKEGYDAVGKCHLFWLTKGDKGQAATGTMEATPADCK